MIKQKKKKKKKKKKKRVVCVVLVVVGGNWMQVACAVRASHTLALQSAAFSLFVTQNDCLGS